MPTPPEALRRIDYCKVNKEENLDLTELYLSEIPIEINELYWLKTLNLSRNSIKKIEHLDKLRKLTHLYLSKNQIRKIEGLEHLTHIVLLDLWHNQITKIEGINHLYRLTTLDLAFNKVSKMEGFEALPKISMLDISGNLISKIEGIKNLTLLSQLFLSDNQITKIEGLDYLIFITLLDLSYNKINRIVGLDNLTLLSLLDLSYNQITKIEGLDNLTLLSELNLSGNQITIFEGLTIEQIKQLETLNLTNNFIEDLPDKSLDNVTAILGLMKSSQERIKVKNRHLKVNIIGEERIGKSQLFNFLDNQKYSVNQKETHGTNTTDYIFEKEYKAKIWDLGGQSYHHGFHKIFIRSNDFNVVLWVNESQLKAKYSYWLGTARNYSPDSSLMLVQNVWTENDNTEIKDFESQKVIYPSSEKLQTFNVGLHSVFAIDVKALHSKNPNWKIQNNYFIDSLHKAMVKHTQTNEIFKEIPRKWLTIKEGFDRKPLKVIYLKKSNFKNTYAPDYDDAEFEILLVYLEFAGNLLYFHDNDELKQYVFPNPPQLSDWIYQTVLNEDFKHNNEGVLDFEKLIERTDIGEKQALIFKEIMQGFNLIFEEKGNKKHLIIPQFLPEKDNSFKSYLLDLIPNSYCIRFADFIHEGRIFQFITEYGEYSEDNSSYWRYGIIFTKRNIKTLVYYNQDERIVFVHIEDKNGRLEIAKEIFDFFVRKGEKKRNQIYISHEGKLMESERIIEFIKEQSLERNIKEEKRTQILEKRQELRIEKIIEGTQISTNGINFFDVKETLNCKDGEINIGICVDSKQKIKLNYLAINLLGMENKKLPKVFISYSRKDLEFKDELKSHLSILERYDLLKSWSCDEIQAGTWNKQIQIELEEADIIIYMVSHNFMASDYIMEQEVKKGIKLVEENPDKKIICVLTRECSWTQWSFLEAKFKSLKGESNLFSESMDLSQYQFLPYHQYKNQEGIAIREEIVALERWGRNIFEVRNVAFQQIVSKILKEIR